MPCVTGFPAMSHLSLKPEVLTWRVTAFPVTTVPSEGEVMEAFIASAQGGKGIIDASAVGEPVSPGAVVEVELFEQAAATSTRQIRETRMGERVLVIGGPPLGRWTFTMGRRWSSRLRPSLDWDAAGAGPIPARARRFPSARGRSGLSDLE